MYISLETVSRESLDPTGELVVPLSSIHSFCSYPKDPEYSIVKCNDKTYIVLDTITDIKKKIGDLGIIVA